jgi:predicted GNAT family acetyltransferase
MTLTDKTGAPVTIGRQPGKFTVAVEGKTVGLAAFAERDGQRVFRHTEVDEAFGGRGLATVMIGEALAATRADGLRIVAVCPMVAAYVNKHNDFDDIVDPQTPQILEWLRSNANT